MAFEPPARGYFENSDKLYYEKLDSKYYTTTDQEYFDPQYDIFSNNVIFSNFILSYR